MFCDKCGAPLLTGDRFCHICGAAVPPEDAALEPSETYTGPELDGSRFGRAARAAGEGLLGGVVTSLLWLLARLFAIAVVAALTLLVSIAWNHRDALAGLFGTPPFSQAEPQPERDAAGSLVLRPVDDSSVELPQAALDTAEQAAQNALKTIYGASPVTGETALELFCNLSEAGYASGQALAEHLNQTCTGTLNQWNGHITGKPLIRANRAYLDVMLYAIRGIRGAPYSFDYDIETDEILICMLWSGSEWLVDASARTRDLLWHHAPFLFSDGYYDARTSGRFSFFFLGPSMLVEPVIPQVCDTLIREVYGTPDGGAVINCWAYNGLSEPIDIDTVDEAYFLWMDGPTYFHAYDYPIEPLHLEPGEGRVLTIVIPPEDILAPLENETELTARVRLIDYR